MDRRDFLRTTGTVIAGATIVPEIHSAIASNAPAPDSTGRIVLPDQSQLALQQEVRARRARQGF